MSAFLERLEEIYLQAQEAYVTDLLINATATDIYYAVGKCKLMHYLIHLYKEVHDVPGSLLHPVHEGRSQNSHAPSGPQIPRAPETST